MSYFIVIYFPVFQMRLFLWFYIEKSFKTWAIMKLSKEKKNKEATETKISHLTTPLDYDAQIALELICIR